MEVSPCITGLDYNLLTCGHGNGDLSLVDTRQSSYDETLHTGARRCLKYPGRNRRFETDYSPGELQCMHQ